MCDYSPLFLHRADECWWVCVTASSFDRRQWTSFGCSTSWQVCYSVYYTADHFCRRFRLSMRMVQCVANTMRVRLPWSVREDRLIPVGACMYVLDSALVSKYSQISPFFFSFFFFSCWLFENYRESSDYVWQSGRDNLWRKARRFSFIGWGLSLGVQRELRALRALNIIQNFY